MNHRPTTRPHIRLRLTAWYAGSVLLLVLLSLFAVRAWARKALVEQEIESTNRAVELVRSFFRTELAEYRSIEPTLFHVSGELVMPDMIVEFIRPDSSVFPGPNLRAAQRELEPPVAEILLSLDRATAPGWKVRLKASHVDRRRAEQRIDRGIFVAVPVAVLLATLVGWLVTGRALRPVAAMAHATERIARGALPERLPISNPDDEFGRLGRRFNHLLDQLDGNLAQQRRFLADAAHELRTPIARMLSTTDVQLSDAGALTSDRAVLQLVHQDLASASLLVDELMELARADAGGVRAELTRLYLDDVVADALVPWQHEARRQSIRLQVSTFEEAPARLDARLITRLVGILVGNAVSYTPAGGTVDVRVLHRDTAAMLEVQDSGVGIAPADRARVFERFFRGEDARRLEPGGSGLGLSIALWIAGVHDAQIEVLDAPTTGTIFRVTFPSV